MVSSYWVINGYLTVAQANGSSLTNWLVAILPGAGLLFLVMMARRAPIPYGSGLLFIGGFNLIIAIIQSWPITKLMGFSFPVILIGSLFLIWKDHFKA